VKFVDEYRGKEEAQTLIRAIRKTVTRPWNLMEICGGQTHTLIKAGIDRLLPEEVTLVHGPGCPVCVTPVELIDKAIIAIIGSLIGMLVYIWFRFKLQWGFAAVAALAHDTLITLALFSIFNQEMSLPVVAAFLTLVGYSVNDTVVVFDRIRENLASYKGKDIADTVNLSINQTLGRTVITSGLTWVVVLSLFLFGGAALRSFSFVLTIGVVVGTYSSIFVASPIVVNWQGYLDRRKERGGPPQQGTGGRKTNKTKKVRRSQTG